MPDTPGRRGKYQQRQPGSLSTSSSSGSCLVNPIREPIQPKKKQKTAFCAELIPLLNEVPEWACHVLHKGFFSGTRTEVEGILCWEQWQELHLLVAVTAYAAWSACGHSSVHTETQALSSRKLIWKKMRYEAVAQHILLSNSTGRHFWRNTEQV